jgi:hypothetical protein
MKAFEINEHAKALYCGASHAVAGGAGDNTAVTGASLDTVDYHSCKLAIAVRAVLAEDATYSLAVALQESDDGTNWDTAETVSANAVRATGGASGSTETTVLEFPVVLRSPEVLRKRYIRFNFTPDLSASGTDVAQTAAVAVLGGKRITVA